MIRKTVLAYLLIAASILLLVFALLAALPGLRHPWRLVFGEGPALPPDLAGCTRVELRNTSRLAEYPFNESEKTAFLTPQEMQYLRSLKFIVVEDRELILDLAHEVASAQYKGSTPTPNRVDGSICVIAYCESDRRTSFTIWGTDLETEDGHVFSNAHFGSVLWRIRPQIWPFQWRKSCANGLQALRARLDDATRAQQKRPLPSQWCDAIDRYMRERRLPENTIKSVFVCPSMREGKCHYAMNPACEPNSPGDTVLLFETKAGWNQHGRPELFTFDNHDPKGGCVLFNDGTVKFIRTEEELKQLRWK